MPDKPNFWVRNDAGTITHTWTDNPDESLVMNMQGLKVVMQFQSSVTDGLSYTSRFFNVKRDNFNKIMIETGNEPNSELRIDNLILKPGSPVSATFDGMLTFTYPENKEILLVVRYIHPIRMLWSWKEWKVRNNSVKRLRYLFRQSGR